METFKIGKKAIKFLIFDENTHPYEVYVNNEYIGCAFDREDAMVMVNQYLAH